MRSRRKNLIELVQHSLASVAYRLCHYLQAIPTVAKAMRPGWLLLAVAAVAGPWYAAVGFRTNGEWLQAFFWKHNVARLLEPMEGHRGMFGYQILMLAICFFPWAFVLPLAIAALIKRLRAGDPLQGSYLLIACWAIVWFAVFSLARTKLPSYVLPAYPGWPCCAEFGLQIGSLRRAVASLRAGFQQDGRYWD